jgi:hypothetical protein
MLHASLETEEDQALRFLLSTIKVQVLARARQKESQQGQAPHHCRKNYAATSLMQENRQLN